MSDRQKAILYAAIEAYIRNAEPVGSHLLAEKYDFGVSPATLRSEFADLEEAGYLAQPHTSAGRVPTDKGYRFFVDELIKRRLEENRKARETFRRLLQTVDEEYELYSELARALAELSGNAVLSGPRGGRALFKSGITEVLRQPELEDPRFRAHFGDIVDSFEQHVDALLKMAGGEPSVFIGKENPFSSARDFSMMISSCKTPSGEGVVVIFGPKRMNYRKNLGLLDALRGMLS